MTVIKNTAVIADTCVLTVTDTTGFYDASANPTGFTPEASMADPTRYKLSDGWFINVVYYNKYGMAPIMINTLEGWSKVTTPDPTIYANNFIPETYQLAQDGSYTLKRVFLISDTFYNANKSGSLFNGKDVYYTNGSTIYKVVGNNSITILLGDFLSASLSNSTCLLTTTNFISTCYLNQCYFRLNMELLPLGLDCATSASRTLQKNRDFIFMTLEVIEYLTLQGNAPYIQKLIESSDVCGIICKKLLTATAYDCGCNG